jgi:hypothetical protein
MPLQELVAKLLVCIKARFSRAGNAAKSGQASELCPVNNLYNLPISGTQD